MADLRKRCTRCRRQFRPQKGASHRKLCYTCSPAKAAGNTEPAASVLAGPGAVQGAGPIEAATLAELESAGRASTSAGVEALHLARLQDTGGHTAQGVAALAKARREAMAVAMAGAKAADDAVDELRRRRLAKAAGA